MGKIDKTGIPVHRPFLRTLPDTEDTSARMGMQQASRDDKLHLIKQASPVTVPHVMPGVWWACGTLAARQSPPRPFLCHKSCCQASARNKCMQASRQCINLQGVMAIPRLRHALFALKSFTSCCRLAKSALACAPPQVVSIECELRLYLCAGSAQSALRSPCTMLIDRNSWEPARQA